MNYMVTVVLCDQFGLLDNEFSKCIGDRGQFSGNFEQFRRRHQTVSRSVQEADRFVMISGGGLFCCQIVSVILVLYSIIFYRDNTIALDAESAVLYIAWFLFSAFGLSLFVGQAIMLNHVASICLICYLYCFTYVWSTVSALMCLVRPVLLSYVTVNYVLFLENK